MFFSTAVPAVMVVIVVYIFIINKFRWKWLSYSILMVAGFLFLANGSVHSTYTGAQLIGLGFLVTRLDPLGYWTKRPWFDFGPNQGDDVRKKSERDHDTGV
jgi:Na+/phosphate symporter